MMSCVFHVPCRTVDTIPTSQPLPQTDANHPWVAQGDVVVTYLGLASAGTTGITGIELPPTMGYRHRAPDL